MPAKSSLKQPAAPDSCHIAGTQPAGFLRRLYETLTLSHQRHVERNLARLLGESGGCLTDEIERRMTQQLVGNHRFRA